MIDDADVLSRASRGELEAKLRSFDDQRVDARLITLRRLDYGISLNSFGEELLETWSSPSGNPLLLMLIETSNKRSAVVANQELEAQLPSKPAQKHRSHNDDCASAGGRSLPPGLC